MARLPVPDPNAPGTVYQPDEQTWESTNAGRFARDRDLHTLSELVNWSVDNQQRFWADVVKDLGIPFSKPYTQVLDTSRGAPWATWFTGGRTNLATACTERWLSSRAAERAVVWEGEEGDTRSWSFNELDRQASAVAAYLRREGLGAGDAVAVHLPLVPENVAVLLGVCKLGGLFIPLFSGFGADAIAARCADADVKVLFTADGTNRRGKPVAMKHVADEARRRIPTLKRVVVFPRLGLDVPMQDGDVWWDDAIEPSGHVPADQLDSEHPWMVIYTSGTTGKPKGTVHVHGGFTVKIAQEGAHQCDARPGDLVWWYTDMGWIMGPWLTVAGLANGAGIFLYDGLPDFPDPGRIWRTAAHHGVTQLGVAPTLVRALMAKPEAKPDQELDKLRAFGSTGEPWNPEPYLWLYNEVGRGRAPIINLSGGTEVGACFLSPLPITPLQPCSLGHPSLGVPVDVVDDAGNAVRGTVGELAARGPWPGMTRGLWRDPDRYIQTYWSRWPNLWYHGDFASISTDGHWFLHGRSDDTIKVAGKRVGPAEVESVLVDTGIVLEAAVVGIPDAVKGEAIHCFVMLRPGNEPEKAVPQLEDAVVRAMGKAFRPGGIHVVQDLPRTRNAKILRRAVRAVAIGKEPGDLTNLANPDALKGIPRVG